MIDLTAAPANTPTSAPTRSTASATPQSTTESSPSPAARPCQIEGTWELDLAVTGGLAGVDRKLELDQTGKYEAADLRQDAKVEGNLAPELMGDVVGLLQGFCKSPETARPPACADCFLYSLQVTLQGVHFELELNDLNVMETPAGELVAFMSQLLNSALEG